jgi:AraC family transcriptional regulator of adaptative response / DNA-3-methyladenine glycosylase II
MYARVLAGDPSANGQFFTGVRTTGIYCLPSCKARKPKSENVRFFPTCEAARTAGLRACRKCHPDDYVRGADPVLQDVERLVGEIRGNPARFADAKAIVQRSGFGTTRLFKLFRQHFHSTPADVLLRARVDTAKRELAAPARRGTPATILSISQAAGFDSVSVFHEQFRRHTGLTPKAFGELRSSRRFSIQLPDDYPVPYLRRALQRDQHSVTERLVDGVHYSVVLLSSGPAHLRLQLKPLAVEVEFDSGSAWEAHAIVAGWIGLGQDAAAFTRLATKLGLPRLVAGRAEMRISQTASVFEGLMWSIIGQQINFPFACRLKSRLTTLAGTPVGDGLSAPPTPAAVAALEPAQLIPLQFSRQKADYLISAARLVAEGKLDLEGLRAQSATRAERTLLSIRGLGPWSVNYLMMRALGFPDCVPLGDTGVTSGLQALLHLDERPDVDATRRLMTVFSPYRSLATAHLWQFNQPPPT